METLTREVLDRLAATEDAPCATVLMPTHPTMQQNAQDPIRLKNLLQAAERDLASLGVRPAAAREQLQPLRSLLEDTLFWSHQSSGLAAFSSPNGTSLLQVPEALDECAVVDRRHYLLPLLALLEETRAFFVLALSPQSVHLLEGTREGMREVDLPEGPEDLEEIARFIESERQLQFHTGAPPAGPANRAAVFHGHGGGESDSERKVRLLEYSRLIDRRLRPVLSGREEQLVLACDRRLAAIYREANSYPHVLEEPLSGNPDLRSLDETCAQAWEMIRPQVARRREELTARCREALGRGRATSELSDVVAAAHDGRVELLLVARGARQWGRFDPAARTASLHDDRKPGDEELLNRAALVAWRNGATVHLAEQEEMPGGKAVTAVMRY